MITAFVTATACGGDDDETPGTGGSGGMAGKAGAAAGGKSGAAGKGGTSGSGGSAGAPAEAGTTGLGGEGGGGTEALVARGDYLVNHVAACPDCHTPRDAMGAPIMDKYLSGSECFVKLPNGDCLNSRNLTNDATGLKKFSDEEIKTMIRDGMLPPKDGVEQALNPVMPYYVFHNMTPDDLDAIVAFLRSVPAVEHDVPANGDSFVVPHPANYLDLSTIPAPKTSFPEYESAVRGRYLATQAGVCIECHTKHNDPGSDDVLMTDKFFAGGEQFDLGLPVTPVSLNLTSDDDTGLGKWTADDIVKVLLQGVDDEGKGICPPMPVGPMGAFGGLTHDDATDIANYIKSLPAIVNKIDDQCTWPLGS
jgi:hypothetical protein